MTGRLSNGGNGSGVRQDRDNRGRFAPGNQAAKGRRHPHAARVQEWRSALTDAITPEDLHQVVRKLVELAKRGERWAVVELLDRCLGKCPNPKMSEPEPSDLIELGEQRDERAVTSLLSDWRGGAS